MFKVFNTKKNQFCAGSRNGVLQHSKKGKVYTDIGHVKSMLKQFFNEDGVKAYSYPGCELSDLKVIEYEVKVKEENNASEILFK